MGRNGTSYMGAEVADVPPSGLEQLPPETNDKPNKLTLPTNPLSRFALAMVPFVPVPLTGPDALYGWGRLAAYTAAFAMTFEKSRKLSYVFAGAAGLSLITSISGKAWNDSSSGK